MAAPPFHQVMQWPAADGADNHGSSNSAVGSEKPTAFPGAQPVDGVQSSGPPPFLNKTYEMVDDPSTDAVVSWSTASNSFVVWNPPEFARDLLPKYFKHNNFSSFVRQLNTYGFRKVDPDRWEFANDGFLRGERRLLKNIHRRKPVPHNQAHQQQPSQSSTLGPCVEVGKFGLEGEIERLKRDKNVLMLELVRLRQQQQATERELQVMGQRFQVTEQRQQQMMSFLAKAMQNPSFLAQLVQQNENSKRLATDRKRRRLPKQEGDFESIAEGQIVKYQPNSSNESTRAVLLQLLNNTDSSSSMEANSSLEALLRDIESAPTQDVDEASSMNRLSSVTLTEMHVPVPNGLPVSVGREVNNDSVHHLSSSSHINIPRPGPANTIDEDAQERETTGNSRMLDVDKRDSEGESMAVDAGVGTTAGPIFEDGKPSALVDGAVISPGVNDVFWEQFLGGAPDSPDGETEEAQLSESSPSEGEVSKPAIRLWGSSKPAVDQLAEQMEQLAPGLKP